MQPPLVQLPLVQLPLVQLPLVEPVRPQLALTPTGRQQSAAHAAVAAVHCGECTSGEC